MPCRPASFARWPARQLALHPQPRPPYRSARPAPVPSGSRSGAGVPAEPARARRDSLDESAIAEGLSRLGMDRGSFRMRSSSMSMFGPRPARRSAGLERQQPRRFARSADILPRGRSRSTSRSASAGWGAYIGAPLAVCSAYSAPGVCMVTSCPRATIRPSRVAPRRTRWRVTERRPRSWRSAAAHHDLDRCSAPGRQVSPDSLGRVPSFEPTRPPTNGATMWIRAGSILSVRRSRPGPRQRSARSRRGQVSRRSAPPVRHAAPSL